MIQLTQSTIPQLAQSSTHNSIANSTPDPTPITSSIVGNPPTVKFPGTTLLRTYQFKLICMLTP